jgi:hypothetical protein
MAVEDTPKALATDAAPFLRHPATYRDLMIWTCPGVS